MSEWENIETAPKDGTSVLLLAEGHAIEGWWNNQTTASGHTYGDGRWDVISISPHGCGCCGEYLTIGDVTKWAPLPSGV